MLPTKRQINGQEGKRGAFLPPSLNKGPQQEHRFALVFRKARSQKRAFVFFWALAAQPLYRKISLERLSPFCQERDEGEREHKVEKVDSEHGKSQLQSHLASPFSFLLIRSSSSWNQIKSYEEKLQNHCQCSGLWLI